MRCAGPSIRPMPATRPPCTATSAVRPGRPVPSTTNPPRTTRSHVIARYPLSRFDTENTDSLTPCVVAHVAHPEGGPGARGQIGDLPFHRGLVGTSRLVAPERDALHHLVVLVDVDAPQQLVVLPEPQAVLLVRELLVVRHELDLAGRVAVDGFLAEASRWPRRRSIAGCGRAARGRGSERSVPKKFSSRCASAIRRTRRVRGEEPLLVPVAARRADAGSGCPARRPAT